MQDAAGSCHDSAYLITRGPQGRMKNCTILCHIEVLASKHLADFGFQVCSTSQVSQQLHIQSTFRVGSMLSCWHILTCV